MVRLFIAIPIPENIRASISDLVAELQSVRGLPRDIRFAPPENWHFTLTFLGYQEENAIPLIKETINSYTMTSEVIVVEFEKLIFGPPGRTPRMIWLTTTKKTSEEMGRLKKVLEDELSAKGIQWRRELRPYQAHLTLARFSQTSIKNLPPIDPVKFGKFNGVEKKLDWSYKAGEIHLMRSTLKRTGAEYEVL